MLAADERYAEKVLTTVKSVCCHNRHIDFYLFNRDFSQEWFAGLNKHLSALDCQIFDVKIDSEIIKTFKTYVHIASDATYFRYFIGEMLAQDKVLYLDCDLVVNGDLTPLFDVELGEHFVAAALDNIAQNEFHINEFNAGVLLINNRLWKAEGVCAKAIDLSIQYGGEMLNGDQTILNELFAGRWLELKSTVNYLVGAEYIYLNTDRAHLVQRGADEVPLILHFNTEYKPWLPIYGLPFREYYWFYHQLSWTEIIQKQQ